MGKEENAALLEITSLLALLNLRWFRNRVNETSRKYNSKNPMYIKSGVLDIGVFLPDGCILFIEGKTPKGKLERSQVDFIAICKANNTPHIVATCAADVKDYLHKRYLGTTWANRF